MQAQARLPSLKIVAASFAFVHLNARDFLRVVWLPFLAMAVLDFILFSGAPADLPADGAPQPSLSVLFAIAAELVVIVTVLVAWHRRVLLGPDGIPAGFPLALGAREGRFFLRLLGLALVMLAFHMFAASSFGMLVIGGSPAVRVVGALGLLGVGLVEFYLASRLVLVLPAAAVDARFGFGDAWRIGADNGWRIAAAWFLTLLPVMIMETPAVLLLIYAESRGLTTGAAIVADALFLLNLVLGSTALSLCFAHLDTGEQDNEPPL